MNHNPVTNIHMLATLLRSAPQAWADIRGDASHPDILGIVMFHQTPAGVIIAADVVGLPRGDGSCSDPVFGFHIHEGGSCTGNQNGSFSDTGGHYDKNGCPHPHHSGDLPPLIGNAGDALLAFLTNRFTVNEIIGRTIVIHSTPDDFISQPSGNSGDKIACGLIERVILTGVR